VVRSRFWKSQRRRRPEKATDWELDLDQIPSDEELSPAFLGEIDETKLHTALDALPDVFRVVVLMFYFEDLSYRQIAEQLELPIGTVMSRLARAKQHLRTSLTAEAEQASSRRELAKR